jgi:chemotaxis methyl-accepting protein methylase
MTTPAAAPLPDDAALAALMLKIERARGLRLTSYKQPCLRRRLAVRMRARGVHSFGDYARVLDQTPDEYDLLLDALTINVTKFFRNPETYAVLESRVVPQLVALNRPVRVWSAGCATGEEPYSLAILFSEAYAGRPGDARARVQIDATDLDPGALAAVDRASYAAPAVDEVRRELLAKYFAPGGPPWRLLDPAKRLVRPVRHDLTHEPAPAAPYDLIVCRNVVIYFDRATQERLFQKFFDALAPGGWLLLGKVETLFGAARTSFRLEDARERLFRRP